jgi:F-type H+-transporting ATPase subunit b
LTAPLDMPCAQSPRRREAEALSEEARGRIADYVSRRTKAVEQRIAQAEAQAVAEVRSRAIDVATAAAGKILAEKAEGRAGDELIERSIAAVRSNLS